MRKAYKLIVIVLIAVLALSLMVSGCQQKRDHLVIGLFLRNLTSPFYNAIRAGAETAIAEQNEARGRKDVLDIKDHGGDIAKEIANYEDAINTGLDIALANPIDPQGSMETINLLAAADNDIVIVNIDGEYADTSKADAIIVSRNEEAGRLQMEKLAEKMGGKGNIIVFANSANANSNIRLKGMEAELAKYPDIKILEKWDSETTIEKCMDAMQNFMQSYQAEGIDGVWNFSDTPANGAASAIKGTPLEDTCVVTGIDANYLNLQLIRDGVQYGSAAQFPDRLGKRGVEVGLEIKLDGKTFTEKEFIDVEWVDQSNVEEHEARWIATGGSGITPNK
ncbi:MAG: sugar ABC transporter substrate-binding protein [Christensenellales bacterium]